MALFLHSAHLAMNFEMVFAGSRYFIFQIYFFQRSDAGAVSGNKGIAFQAQGRDKCKGPEAGGCLQTLKNNKEVWLEGEVVVVKGE